MKLPALPSWVELHAMVTHFPIALLIVAATAEVASLLVPKRPEWSRFLRQTSLLLLTLTVISTGPAMLTGWLYGRDFRRPPLDYAMHWKMAWVSTVLAAIVLVWRLARRDRIGAGARALATVLLLGATVAVGYTGHLGGNMVFGDSGSADDTTPAPIAMPSDETSERLDLAAEKMEIASERLDVATDRINLALSQEHATEAQAAAAQAEASAVRATAAANKAAAPSLAPALVAASPESESTDQRLAKVADRYDAVADKLDQVAKQLEAQPVPGSGAGWVPLPIPTTPAKGAPGATAAPAGPDPAQVALGSTLFHSDDMACLSCHKLAGSGGRGGPNLDGEGEKHPDANWQYQHLISPKSETPNSAMPDYDPADSANADLHLTPEKLKAMAAYMTTLK